MNAVGFLKCAWVGVMVLLGLGLSGTERSHAATNQIPCSVTDLITAIDAANANPDADTLELANHCAYTLTKVNNTDPVIGPNGLPVITSDITLNGNNAIIARDDAAPAFRFFQINNGARLMLDQLTLTGGATPNGVDAGQVAPGGAIFNGGTCHLIASILSGNSTGQGSTGEGDRVGDSGDGGAIFNTGTLTISHSTLSDNSTGTGMDVENAPYGGNGGNGGAILNKGTAFIADSTVSWNYTGEGGWGEDIFLGNKQGSNGGNGGAVYSLGPLNLSDVTLLGNHTGDGGDGPWAPVPGSAGGNGGSGGAVYTAAEWYAINITLEGNAAGDGGGGYDKGGNGGNGGALYHSNGSGELADSHILANVTGKGGSGRWGGTGGNGAGTYNSGTLTLNNCEIAENSTGIGAGGFSVAPSGAGGGVFNAVGGTLLMTGCEVHNNHSSEGTIEHIPGGPGGNGGGLVNEGIAHIIASTLEDNNAGNGGGGMDCFSPGGDGGSGGGILNSGTLEVRDSTLKGNAAGEAGSRAAKGGDGGGILNIGTLEVSNSTLTGNSAGIGGGYSGNGGDGGGILNSGTLELSNSTLTGNTAGGTRCNYANGGHGGGIANTAGTTSLRNLTITENRAGLGLENGNGGNLFNSAEGVAVSNSILADPGIGSNCSGSFNDGGGNLRFPKSDATCPGIAGNPRLGPLTDNGGPTYTMSLAADSRAINAAVNATCPTADQRGISRPQGKQCDIGSFELEPPTKPALLKPFDGKELAKLKVKLNWTAAERIDHYQVIVRQDSAKGKKVLNKEVTTTDYKTPALERGHWYFWRIKACSNVGCTSLKPWRFQVK